MKEQDRIWKLITKKLTGEATAEDLRELQELLKAHPEQTYSLQLLIDLWKPAAKGDHDHDAPEAAFHRHMKRLASRQEKAVASAVSRYRPPENGKKWSLPSKYSLLRNYSKTIARNLLRNKTFSFINITGLAIGMASALIILL